MKLLTKIHSKRKEIIYPLILGFICLILIILNRTPDTFLSGWDTLHPEFNFGLNFQRLFFGVFREEQGVGAVAAHAHMADLPRVILLWLSSFVFPTYFLRFFLISLCLPVGVLGVYYFSKDVVFSKKPEGMHFAFISALFYLFNLGTLQHFYVPFEMFTVAYALIPWLFWSVSNYLIDSTKRNLLIFSSLTFFASPMAYAPILWYVYFGSLLLFLIPFLKSKIKLVRNVVLLTLLVNAFWILPNVYFLVSGHAALVPEARINKIFSEEAYTFNKSFGSVKDALIFKNFLFDWPVYEGQNSFGFLLDQWRSYIQNRAVLVVGYILSVFYLIGLLISYKSRNKYLKSLILPFIVTFIFLINSTPPFEWFFSFLRENSSLFREALRFPFTKFSLIFIFITSVFFGCGVYFFSELIRKSIRKFKLPVSFSVITISVFSLLLVFYAWPFFKGELISQKMQVKIPNDYFRTFEYLDSNGDSGRVAILPAHTFWGWIYYNWGFQGAQFVSFGIKQPLMDRDYDRWNPKNEQYYREISNAVYTQDKQAFENVLKKYQIKYLVVDENIKSPGPTQDSKLLYLPEIKSLLEQFSSDNGKIKLAQKFDTISIYEYSEIFTDIGIVQNPVKLSVNQGFHEYDIPFSLSQNYLSEKSEESLSFPFWPFYDNQNIVDKNIIDTQNNHVLLKNNSDKITTISTKEYHNYEDIIPVKLFSKRSGSGLVLKLEVGLSEEKSEIIHTLPFEINSNESLVINIDESQTVEIKSFTDNFEFQKEVLLSLKNYNNLSFYKKSNESPVTFSGEIIRNQPDFKPLNSIEENSLLRLCSKSDRDQIWGFDATDADNIKIASKNSQTCLWIPLEKIMAGSDVGEFKDLFSYSFNTETTSTIMGRVCIYDKSANRCIKEKKYITNEESFEDYFPLNSNDLEKLDLVLYLDGNNNQKLENYSFKNLSFGINKPVGFLTIDPKELIQKISSQQINKNEKGDFLISLGTNAEPLTLNLYEPYHKSNNCGNNSTKFFERNLNQQEKYLEFKTLSGSNCDFFSVPQAPHNIGYLIEVEAQNIKGLPLRMCVANNFSRRCEVYLSLQKNGSSNKYLIAVPPTKDGGVGIDIHFDNYSVGNFETVNRITSLKLTPFPYNFVTSLMTGSGITPRKAVITDVSPKVEKLFPFLYKISLNRQAENQYLTFDNSFEKGWYLTSSENHSEYNGWSNIYKLKDGADSVWLIYLPEFLQLSGFALLLGFLIRQIIYLNLPGSFRKLLYFNDYWIRKIFSLKPLRPFNQDD